MTVISRRLQGGDYATGGRPRKGATARVARRAQGSPAAYAFLIVVLLASVFPLWWSFVIGSKDAAAINSGEVSLLPGGERGARHGSRKALRFGLDHCSRLVSNVPESGAVQGSPALTHA